MVCSLLVSSTVTISIVESICARPNLKLIFFFLFGIHKGLPRPQTQNQHKQQTTQLHLRIPPSLHPSYFFFSKFLVPKKLFGAKSPSPPLLFGPGRELQGEQLQSFTAAALQELRQAQQTWEARSRRSEAESVGPSREVEGGRCVGESSKTEVVEGIASKNPRVLVGRKAAKCGPPKNPPPLGGGRCDPIRGSGKEPPEPLEPGFPREEGPE